MAPTTSTRRAEHFVHFLENHDQVANSARGFRLATLASPGAGARDHGLLLLGPQTPCLFQGQEFGATNPFLYFLGLEGDEAKAVAEGRRESLTNFPSVADPAMQARLPDPADLATLSSSKLDWTEAERHARHAGAAPRPAGHAPRATRRFRKRASAASMARSSATHALLIRYITPDPAGHRLLLVNLGRDLQVGVVAEPLLAPARGHRWAVDWSSEHPDYDGAGRRPIDPTQFWILPGDCALLSSKRAKPMTDRSARHLSPAAQQGFHLCRCDGAGALSRRSGRQPRLPLADPQGAAGQHAWL